MLADYKEEQIKCSGRLGNYLTLFLRVQHKIIDKTHKISLRLRISREKDILDEDMNRLIELKENQVTVRLRAADKVLAKKSVPIDFTLDNTTNILLLEYEYEITNEQTLIMYYFGDIIIDNDDSNYLTNTTIKTDLVLTPVVIEKLFIDLNCSELKKYSGSRESGKKPEDLIYYHYDLSINTTIEPDFLELKINENNWTRINYRNFDLPIADYLRYVQVRGKKDNYYSYSNVIRLEPETI